MTKKYYKQYKIPIYHVSDWPNIFISSSTKIPQKLIYLEKDYNKKLYCIVLSNTSVNFYR